MYAASLRSQLWALQQVYLWQEPGKSAKVLLLCSFVIINFYLQKLNCAWNLTACKNLLPGLFASVTLEKDALRDNWVRSHRRRQGLKIGFISLFWPHRYITCRAALTFFLYALSLLNTLKKNLNLYTYKKDVHLTPEDILQFLSTSEQKCSYNGRHYKNDGQEWRALDECVVSSHLRYVSITFVLVEFLFNVEFSVFCISFFDLLSTKSFIHLHCIHSSGYINKSTKNTEASYMNTSLRCLK